MLCEDNLQAATEPMGMRNMAKYRTPTTVDPAAIALPMQATIMSAMMWNERSFVLAELSVTQMESRNVANYQSSR